MTLVLRLRHRAAEDPDRPAFTFLDAAGHEVESLTFGELDTRARAIAAALQEVGAAGERALLLHPPGLGFIASFLGCLYAGVVAVPAYPPGRNRPPARLRSIAADARARVVLAPASIVSDREALAGKIPELGAALWLATDEVASEAAASWRETSPSPADLAFLQYTSGSTSDPKGVMVTHGNLVHNEEAIRRAFGMLESSVVVGWLPLYHDMGLIGNVLQPLYAGARAVLMAPLSFLQRPALWLEAVSRYRATTSGGPNFAYDLCARRVTEAEKAALDLSSWTVAFNGAEPVRVETLDRFAEAFASCGFRREAFLPCYGLAEATLFVSGAALEAAAVVGSLEERPLVGCGQAAEGLTVKVVDPEARTVAPEGGVGEIWVEGPSVAAGYWDRPEETERTFGAHLADGSGPFLRTGDLGLAKDGELFVTGRLKDLIILRGRNLYPHDLERTAEASHPALRPGGGAAFSVDRDGEERLVILHEVERSRQVDPGEVLEAVRRAVGEEHEVAVEEVVLLRSGTILKTSSGKIRRAACRQAYLDGKLVVVARSGGVAPRERNSSSLGFQPQAGVDIRRRLLQETARVLRRSPAEIDPRAPLIALGLDSLAATELRSALEERFGVTLPLSRLLEGATLEDIETEGGDPAPPAPEAVPDGPGLHPLSEGQRALWFLDRLNPAAAALHLAGAARVPEGLDGEALRRALERLQERHAALRTTFEARDGEPVRRIHERLGIDFAVMDDLPLASEAYRPFDLEREALLRVRVGRKGGVLLLAVHHLIADYASMAVLLRDLLELYGGVPSRVAAPGPGYSDWIRRHEKIDEGVRAWWHERLAGELPALDLPADRPRPLERSWRAHVHTTRLEGVAEGLRQVGRSRGATLFSTVLAGLQAALHRWTGQDEVLVGAPASLRGAGYEDEIGYFINPVVLRLGLGGEPSFAELAGKAGAVAIQAFDHGAYPFPRLARELRPERDPARSPLFQAMLVLQPARDIEERALAPFALGEAGARARAHGITLESLALPEGRAQMDLTLFAAEVEHGGLALSLQLDADLFDPATGERLLGHLSALLRAGAADPGHGVLEIDLLSASERAQLAAWGEGAPPLPSPASREREPLLHELVAQQAERTPGAIALVHGDERWRYGELWSRAARLAARLRALGVGPEVRVGVCAGRSPELVTGLLAVLEAGGAYVPLDPAYPAERQAFLLEDSGAALLLVGPGIEAPATDLPVVRIGTETDVPTRPSPRSTPGNLAYLIYTSGSTGRPKAVAIEHRSAVALMDWTREVFPDRELDGLVAATSIGFDLSVFELFAPLCRGGRVILAGSILDLPDLRTDPRLVNTVPSAMSEVLRARGLPASVETVCLAGEPLRRELVRALFDAGARRVVNLYGPSEDTTYSTIAELRPDGEDDPSIGRPVAGTRARVLDARMRPVPVGVVGELFLGGAGLARGYLGRPDLTAERFVPSPFAEDGPGARLYRTGDRTRWRADGELAFLGRLDHQVKVRGFRVEPGEIETALASHPAVEEAVVLAQGEGGERRLVAYVKAPPGEDLRHFLGSRLPGHMIPSAFVFLDVFPRTPNGKLDRKALAALDPETPGMATAAAYEPPRTPLEESLAGIWAEVLGVERVGIRDRFFDLGGHSLLAARLQARVRERLGLDLPLSAIFRAPTVAGLARLVEEAAPWRLPAPEPVPRDAAAFPLSFAQERMWLLHRMDPASAAYNVSGEVRLRGALDTQALARALRELVRCHETLRTRFPEEGGQPVQVVGPLTRGRGVVVIDVEGFPQEADRLAREEARRPFDLASAPPVRAMLLRLGPEEHLLLLTLHHIAADEASLGVLARDLGAAYEGSPLSPSRLQMADVAVWQREHLSGDTLQARLGWWKARLADLPRLDLPTDRPRQEPRSDQGGTVSVPLPATVLEGLSTLARREGATLFMTLLAGFQAFLSRISGALDFAVGSPFSTRDHADLEGVVGPLLNTLALRADLSGDPTFHELLGRVRDTAVAAHERADLPFEMLGEYLEVLFVLHRPPAALQASGLTLEPRAVPTGTAKFEMTLYALERDLGIELELEHSADLWEQETVARWLAQIGDLLARAAADPGLRLSELPPWLEGERRQVSAADRPLPVPHVAPRTPVEQLLAGIWEDLLGVERAGIHDDFFALGGQSLLGVRVTSRLREALGVELPLRALFEHRTIAALAARLEAQDSGTGPPLVPVSREGGLPLSFGQERLWFLDRLEPGSPVYNMPGAVRLAGPLDPQALRGALTAVAGRHEILRTSFPAPEGEPMQVAAPWLDVPLPLADLSVLLPEEARTEADRLSSAMALLPFNLETGPLLRAALLRLAKDDHVLLLTVHHIAFDGWSLGIFLRDLTAMYRGEVPVLPIQYGDFAVWQRERLTPEALAPSIAWWREALSGAPPVLDLPLDRPRAPVQTFHGGSLRLTLGPETARNVREIGRRFEATAFMTLLAAWAALLSRYTGETDLVVGTAVAGRDRMELEPLIGLFAENLALRLDLGDDPDMAGLLARSRETVLAAWAHREVPFERLVRELRPERDLSHTPLYQAVLTLDASDRPPLELPGIRVETLPVESGTAKFDLALYLEDRGGVLSGLLEYNRDLFDAATAARLLASFERLADSLRPDRRVSALPLISEAERRQLFAEAGAPALAEAVTVPRRIEAWAAADPDALAVSGLERTLSYGELDRRASLLARRLRALGVGPEVPVAVCLQRSPELIVALLGVWKAGGVYVPLDPTLPEERLAWMAEDSGAPVLLASRLGPIPGAGPSAVLFVEGDAAGSAEPGVALHPESAAYLVYTSGSTGRPKGVLVPHGALAAYAAAMDGLYAIGPGDRVLQSAALGFDLSLDEIVPCLTGGAELALRDDAMLASAAAFLGGCRERGITVVSLPTALWHEMAAGLTGEESLPPGLRLVILGGERLLPERLAAWRRHFPSGPRLLNTYGPTEATILVTAAELDGRAGEAPIGRPVSGAQVWLLGPHGEAVPTGARGEIHIGGRFLARGYLGQPDRTAERFVPHPFEPGERLYRTGDFARRLTGGSLEFVGRVDAQAKLRGYRIEPGEVEATLARHPGLEAAAVAVRKDARGRLRLVAYAVPRQPAPTEGEVRSFLSAILPEPLVPSEIVFLEAMPLTPHGKIDRRALPEPGARMETAALVPRDRMEREIAEIWSEALGVETVGVEDNFFDLGGHSMLLARVHVLLRERLGHEVPLVDLFRYPTVAALARHLAPASAPAPAWGRGAEAAHASLSRASAAFLRFASRNTETLERSTFADSLAGAEAVSPYPLQPWPALVDRSRVVEMERVSTGLVRLVKSLPRRVFGNEPGHIRDFYGLPSLDMARSLIEEPNGIGEAIGRGDFMLTADGLQCLELNLVSDLGGWQSPLWAEGCLGAPVFARFLREEGLRVACRDTVSLLLRHAVATARHLGEEDGEINTVFVLPEGGEAPGDLETWLAARHADALRAEAPGADGRLLLLPYSRLRERGGRLWTGDRRVHAAVEIHHEGTAAQAFRCFKAGTLKLFNAPVRSILTDKRNLALLSELADRGEILTPAERELVSHHLPWTRRLLAETFERVLESREEMVIKRAGEGQGAAVHVGAFMPEAEWRKRVRDAVAAGDWIAQRRVESLPFVHQHGERGAAPHDAVWGLFVLGERYGGGFLSLRARDEDHRGIVNLTRGATAGVILEVLEDAKAPRPEAPTQGAGGIAIVGMAGRFPGAGDVERFWENLEAGVESITFFRREELVDADPRQLDDPAYVPARALIDGIEEFDAALFGFTPREAEVMDPQHRLLLEVAWEALERAGCDSRREERPIGVYAGSGPGTYLLFHLASNRELLDSVGPFQTMLGNGSDFLATRLSYKLGLRGPSLTVQTACSTSLVAVHLATSALLQGECDIALAGGVRLSLPRRTGYLFQTDGILSPDGHCRPFDADGRGAVDGEGAAIVVLKRLEDALADGDHIHAVILGTAVTNDGSDRVGYTAPGVEGQAGAIARAQEAARVAPETIGFVEGHGTATPLGDPVEVAALKEVFGATSDGPWCALGSVKGNVGHLDTAAGVTSLIKAALALERGVIPPTVHFRRPNPGLGLEGSPFFVNAEPVPWPPGPSPRRAGVSSFGMGGTNAHVVLQEAPPLSPGSPSKAWQVLVLSAASEAALDEMTARLADHLERHPHLDLADVAFTLQTGRRVLPHRRFLVCRDLLDAVRGLRDPGRFNVSEDEEAAAGERWLAGDAVDWRALYPGERRRRVPLPTYPFERRRYWIAAKSEPRPVAPPEPPQPLPAARNRPNLAVAFVPPRNETEQRVADLYRELLGVDPIGAFDSFFEIGGHSLLGLQLLSRLRSDLGAEIPLDALFQVPVVADLAELVEVARAEPSGEIPRAPRDLGLPLSFGQERLWLLDRLDPGTPAFNLDQAVRLTGALDPAALARAVAEIVRRHESLRTAFVDLHGRPVQRVLEAVDVPLPLVDLSALPESRREPEAERLATRAGDRRFDLSRPPLLDLQLYRLAPDRHVAALVLHHIVGDGWSITVFLSELAGIYRAFAAGEPSPLPEPPIQYADFAVWQRSHLQEEEIARQLADWRRVLAPPLPGLELPTDRPRPAVQTFRGANETLRLSPALAEDLRALGRQQGATPFMVLLSGFALLLSRWSGQEDVIVGSPIAGRDRHELEGLIGIFLNMLPLRIDRAGEPSFRDLIGRAREAALGAYARQDVPIERLIEELQPRRDLSRSPLFQALFNLQDFPRRAFDVPGLSIEALPLRETPSRFDLTLYGEEAEAGAIALEMVYNADLFDAATMRHLLGQLGSLLGRAVADPDVPVSRLSLLTLEAEAVLPDPRAPLPTAWSGPIHERFAAQALRHPDRTAVVDPAGSWTYGELAARVDDLAWRLRASGIGSGDLVAIHAHRSAHLAQALLGVLAVGAAFVILDPAHPVARRLAIVRQARPRTWIEISAAGPLPDEIADEIPSLSAPLRLPATLPPLPSRLLLDARETRADDLAYVAFTSGSTGEPKGILGTHGPLSHFVDWHAGTFGLGEDDRFSLLSGLSHDPLLRDVLTPLALGATLCIPERDDLGSPSRLTGWMASRRVTVCHLTPALGQLLADGGTLLLDLRRVFFGGDVLTEGDVERMRAVAPGAACVNFYGTTETPQAIAWFDASRTGDWPARRVPVGHGIDGAQLLVLNPAGELAAPGELGEIGVRTPYLSLGYLGDDRGTAERFVTNPFTGDPEDRLYRTGDLGRYRSEGTVDLAGRRDVQIQVRGFRVEPAEVGAALARHPAVRDSVVLLHEAEGKHRLAAWIVAAPGQSRPGSTELRDHLRRYLPDPMVPEVFVWLDRLPLTPNGKLDRLALPEPGQAEKRPGSEAPATPAEEMVAAIWRELLGLEAVGRHDNFFDLGGHSLLAARVVARVQEAFGVELPLRRLFDTPTVAGIAGCLTDAAGSSGREEEMEADISFSCHAPAQAHDRR